jgi:hypothetical protein
MLSMLHEALVMLFRNEPRLAPELLRDALSVALPVWTRVDVKEATLTEIVPTEYRADLVVLPERDGEPVFGIVVEVQLGRDEEKQWSWPLYASALRAKLRVPTCVLVVAPEPAVARWAAGPIETGQPGCPFVPMVLGPGAIPYVTDLEQASKAPELAVLSALAHGQEEEGAKVALAAIGAARGLDPDRARLYHDLVLSALNEAARKALEELMASGRYEYQSDFAKKYLAEGRAEGWAEGKAEGKAEGRAEGKTEGRAEGRAEAFRLALVRVLARRGFTLTSELQRRIDAETDLERLERWLDVAVTAASLAEVFADA